MKTHRVIIIASLMRVTASVLTNLYSLLSISRYSLFEIHQHEHCLAVNMDDSDDQVFPDTMQCLEVILNYTHDRIQILLSLPP